MKHILKLKEDLKEVERAFFDQVKLKEYITSSTSHFYNIFKLLIGSLFFLFEG